MRNRRKIALIITLQCLSISQLYLYFSGTSFDRDLFRKLTDYLLPNQDENVKAGGLILLVFTVPLLVAGAACIFLLSCIDNNHASTRQDTKESIHGPTRSTAYAPIGISNEEHDVHDNLRSVLQRTKWRSNLIYNLVSSPRRFAIIFILIPCLVFYMCNVSRHYQLYKSSYPSTELTNAELEIPDIRLISPQENLQVQVSRSKRQLLQHIANDSAIMALVSMAYLLVPISKHSPLVVLARWSPVEAIAIHKWAGRLGIVGAAVHGGLHFVCGYWRWWSTIIDEYDVHRGSSWSLYLPPWSCWKSVLFGYSNSLETNEADFGFGCYQESSPCQCHDFFLNLTGLVGFIALITLGLSSIGYVRRHYYRVFYLVHITAGPCFMVMTVLHYNKAIIYFCPSLLYYASTSIPNYVQNWMHRLTNRRGTRIFAVTNIPCRTLTREVAVWDIVFECTEDASEQFRPGQNCTLHVPRISAVSHPFTVNRIPGYNDRLRLLIRETGEFTNQLGKCLNEASLKMSNTTAEDEEPQLLRTGPMPTMHISGFYGIAHRINQLLSHDHAIIIAGGIGITPYLSLLMDVLHPEVAVTPLNRLKTVELHWLCRDIHLIQFIYQEYFSEMTACPTVCNEGRVPIVNLIVHYTGSKVHLKESCSSFDLIPFKPRSSHDIDKQLHPMTLSYFSIGANQSKFRDILAFMGFTSIFIVGLRLVCFYYAKDETATRLISVLSVILSSIGISVGLSRLADAYKAKYPTSVSKLRPGCNYSAVNHYQDFNGNVSYEQLNTGRPNIPDILLSLRDADNPGIFACGPRNMVDSLRKAVNDCLVRVSVYEEFFEQ